MLAALTFGVATRAQASVDAGLAAEGWIHGDYEGPLHPAAFTHRPDGLTISGEAAGSFAWRRVEGSPGCLSWRWRVDAGPSGTDLTHRGGDDRAIGITVGFQGWPPHVTAWQRTQHAVAQLRAGSHRLPRSLLIYVWGGTGREPPLFLSPWVPGIARVRVLRHARDAHEPMVRRAGGPGGRLADRLRRRAAAAAGNRHRHRRRGYTGANLGHGGADQVRLMQ
jgi:hypothetical protein